LVPAAPEDISRATLSSCWMRSAYAVSFIILREDAARVPHALKREMMTEVWYLMLLSMLARPIRLSLGRRCPEKYGPIISTTAMVAAMYFVLKSCNSNAKGHAVRWKRRLEVTGYDEQDSRSLLIRRELGNLPSICPDCLSCRMNINITTPPPSPCAVNQRPHRYPTDIMTHSRQIFTSPSAVQAASIWNGMLVLGPTRSHFRSYSISEGKR
jgi:hypothetical protein